MTEQNEEIAALRSRLAEVERRSTRSAGPSLLALVGRGVLLVIAICCGFLVIGATQVMSTPRGGSGDFILAIIVTFVGIVCAWLAFRRTPPK